MSAGLAKRTTIKSLEQVTDHQKITHSFHHALDFEVGWMSKEEEQKKENPGPESNLGMRETAKREAQRQVVLDAMERPHNFSEPVDISLMYVLGSGMAHPVHPAPDGTSVGMWGANAIGSYKNLAKVELNAVSKLAETQYSIDVTCYGGSEVFHVRYYVDREFGSWIVNSKEKHAGTSKSKQIDLMLGALKNPTRFLEPPDISLLFDAHDGRLNYSHPAANCEHLGSMENVGIGGHLSKVELLETFRYKDAMAVSVQCSYADGRESRNVKYLVLGKKVIPFPD